MSIPPLKNQSYDDEDTQHIQYGGFWFNTGTYNATNTGETGTLSSTNDVNANLTFPFPQPAYAFYYYGIPRGHGATYQICIDCDPNDMQWRDVPYNLAHNATDDGKNPPIVLYSQSWQTPGFHRVIITNRPDPNFNNTSQLTIDRIDLAVVDDSAPPSSSSASSPSNTPTSTPPAPTNNVPAIVGGVVGAIVFLAIVISVFINIRLRRRKRQGRTDLDETIVTTPYPTNPPVSSSSQAQTSSYYNSYPTPITSSDSSPPTRAEYTTTPTKRQLLENSNRQAARGESRHHPSASIGTSSVNPPSSSGPSVTRERDAGPVSFDYERENRMSVLPPDYQDATRGVPS